MGRNCTSIVLNLQLGALLIQLSSKGVLLEDTLITLMMKIENKP